MSRTRRNIPYKHYWGDTKEECKNWADQFKGTRYYDYYYHRYLLHGTDTANVGYRTHEYFNRAHRLRRRLERDQLRPHIASEDFDDSRAVQKYRGIWWEIY